MTQLLGWVGSALVVISLTQRRAVPFRLLNLASAAVLLAFNLFIGLWSMVALNVIILIVNSWQLRAITAPDRDACLGQPPSAHSPAERAMVRVGGDRQAEPDRRGPRSTARTTLLEEAPCTQ